MAPGDGERCTATLPLKSDPAGFDYWNILPGQGIYENPAFIEMGVRKTHPGYVTDVITDFAIEYLRERKEGQPFCLVLHHKATHRPWKPDDERRAIASSAAKVAAADCERMMSKEGIQLLGFCGSRKITPPKPDFKMPTRQQVERALLNEKYDGLEQKYLRTVRGSVYVEYRNPDYALQ